ncbi:MAG: sulfite exporter TauE/SafE family protein [Candidatus Aminicenantes bacterium]|nr:sulfite exporter TauE/SafE family protein [Candidatus Aminicenantes bacterium]
MELIPDLWSLLAVFLITLCGTLVQGTIGYGLGPLSVPLLVLIDPGFIPGPLLLSALVLTGLMAYRDQHSINLKGVAWAVPGRILGSIGGAFLLGIIPGEKMGILFGGMVILAILLSLSGIRLRLTGGNILLAGILSGIMGTTSAIGGAPMALVYQRQEGPEIRGTLSVIFVFGTIISLTALAVIGRFGLPEIKHSVVLLPGVLSGYLLSGPLTRIMNKDFIRPLILGVAALAGAIVILKSIH